MIKKRNGGFQVVVDGKPHWFRNASEAEAFLNAASAPTETSWVDEAPSQVPEYLDIDEIEDDIT
jgi:hypothetical protein